MHRDPDAFDHRSFPHAPSIAGSDLRGQLIAAGLLVPAAPDRLWEPREVASMPCLRLRYDATDTPRAPMRRVDPDVRTAVANPIERWPEER